MVQPSRSNQQRLLRYTGQPVRKPTQQQTRFPMPVGGLNFVDSTMSLPPTDAYLLDNLMIRPFGIEVRKGWRYWVPEANSFTAEVRSVLVYNARNSSNSRCWTSPAYPAGALYDTTSPNVVPTVSLTPSTSPDTPGEWYGINYITPGGAFYCAVTAGGGYYVYSVNETTNVGTWTEVTTGTGAGKIEFPSGDTTTTKDFCFIWSWKSRLWFLKRNSSIAYYLPINSISGKAEQFDFGGQFVHGGQINFATSWTYDSGAGLDDGLIIASNEGDLLIYEGTDPASVDTFALKGQWYTGRFPFGRRCFTQHGGDCLLLTEYGMVSVADLVAGKLHTSGIQGNIAFKVNPRLARIITQDVNVKYWTLLPYPVEETLLVFGPYVNSTTGIRQGFMMNSITNAWSTFSEMDILSAEIYQGNLIIGTRSGAVIQGLVGYNDGVSSDGVDVGSAVTGRLQTAFLDYGDPTKNKRMLRVRICGLADATPSIFCIYKPEYRLNELLSTPAPVIQTQPAWDVALWDNAIWDANSGSFDKWFGVSGFGKKMSLQLAVRGAGNTLLTDYETLYETGIGM